MDSMASTQKFAVLQRLLPFVEKRINLMELAPAGTGKSYLFGQISRHGWLVSGKVTRAKLIYDIGKRKDGVVALRISKLRAGMIHEKTKDKRRMRIVRKNESLQK